MDPSSGFGTVMSLKQLFDRFYKSNVAPPSQPQAQIQATPK
jgi:hypothetical protein